MRKLAIVMILAAGTASANGTATETPPAAVKFDANDWSGFYAGLSHGMGVGSSNEMYDIGGPYVLNTDASFPAGFVGYRHDMGRMVVGGELSTTFDVNMYQQAWPNWTFNSLTDLRATLGYDMGRALVYASAGYTTSSFDAEGSEYTYDGWNAGIGIDYLLSDRVFLGAEYVHRDVARSDLSSWNGSFDTFHLRIGMNF